MHNRNCPLILLLSLPYHNRLGALATLAKGNDGDLFSQDRCLQRQREQQRHFILMCEAVELDNTSSATSDKHACH